jgi:hypothetical protein
MKSLKTPKGRRRPHKKHKKEVHRRERSQSMPSRPCRGGLQGLQMFAGFVIRYPFCIFLIPTSTWELRFLVREAALETLQIPSNPALGGSLLSLGRSIHEIVDNTDPVFTGTQEQSPLAASHRLVDMSLQPASDRFRRCHKACSCMAEQEIP